MISVPSQRKKYNILVEFESENGLDMELILGELEAAISGSAPHAFDIFASEIEEMDE